MYKTIGIVELMHKTNQWVPPEIQQMVDSQLRRQQVSFIICTYFDFIKAKTKLILLETLLFDALHLMW